MTFDQIIQHFGNQTAAARALGLTQGAVHQWKGKRIPPFRQLQIQRLTKGKLKAEENVLGLKAA